MEKRSQKTNPVEKWTYTVQEVATILGIGRTATYKLIKEERFRYVRIGNSIRVLKKSFDAWMESLEGWGYRVRPQTEMPAVLLYSLREPVVLITPL